MISSWKHCTGVAKLQRVRDEKRDLARSMRKEMTPAEQALWNIVRNRRLGPKFRRQQVIDGFVADFYCEEHKLAVEVDGPIHNTPKRQKTDKHREAVFLLRGIRTVRFTNDRVLCRTDEVVEELRKVFSAAVEARSGDPRIRAPQ
jgi:very-short-patch-repair endonuclease